MNSVFHDVWLAAISLARKYYDGILRCDLCLSISTAFVLSVAVVNLAAVNYKRIALRFASACPLLGCLVERKINEVLKHVHAAVHGSCRTVFMKRLPSEGLTMESVLNIIRKYKATEYIRWQEGFASGSVYARDSNLADLLSQVFREFVWTNPLHPDLFPDIRRMEAEVVRMCVDLFHGDDQACGTTTSGGTESIMLACLAYRELSLERGIRNPVMLIPESAHPAFDKAGHFFRIQVQRIPVDPVTFKVDVNVMRSEIGRDVCMIVGSAPGFPHGIVDPIREISELGLKFGIPVHVDCCLGGFLLPFMDQADYPIEPFDFRLPGVTSISCDTHKYGFAAKGTSVIMYRNADYRARQFFTQPDWSGGLYASPTFAGSRSGALIAVCWATMMFFGRRGYIESTRRIVKTTRYIAEELRKIPGIFVLGNPEVCVVAFGTDKFDIYHLSEGLSKLPNGRGWALNNLQFPVALHLCVTDLHTAPGRAEAFIRDVAAVAAELRGKPQLHSDGAAAIYGMSAILPDRSIVSRVARGFLDACYDTSDPCVSANSNAGSKSQTISR